MENTSRIYDEQIIKNINYNVTCSGYNSLYWICHCIALTTPNALLNLRLLTNLPGAVKCWDSLRSPQPTD